MTDKTRRKFRQPLPLSWHIEAKSIPEPNSGCWLWLKYCCSGGYGRLRLEKIVKAHRVSWIAYKGPIPSGMHVLHRCDTPSCVNPDHLWLGTHKDNMRDMFTKRRRPHAMGDRNGARLYPERLCRGDSHPLRKDPSRVQGEKNPYAKLTTEAARAIKSSSLSSAALSKMHSVSTRTINDIRSGKTWREA